MQSLVLYSYKTKIAICKKKGSLGLEYQTKENINCFRRILEGRKIENLFRIINLFFREPRYLNSLLCAIFLKLGEGENGWEAGAGGEGSISRKIILRNELLRLQNNEIQISGEAVVPRRLHSDVQVSNSSFLMVKRACQPSVNQSLRLKKTYCVECECSWVNENIVKNKTWTPLYMGYLSCHVVYFYGCSLSLPFTFFVIFGSLCACLGIKKVFAAYLILLGTWRALKSGPEYLSSGCLVRGLGTTVLRTISFTFGRGSRQLSSLFSIIFWYLILTKSNIIL